MIRKPLFYGWIIVSVAIIGMMLVYGTRNSFSVFFPPILAEFGWSRGSTAFMLSLNLLVYGFTAPIAGGLSDRWKPRLVVPVGITILGVATACCAFASELWHFYVLFGILMPFGTAFSGWPVIGRDSQLVHEKTRTGNGVCPDWWRPQFYLWHVR
jgi:sugar phosphate permease